MEEHVQKIREGIEKLHADLEQFLIQAPEETSSQYRVRLKGIIGVANAEKIKAEQERKKIVNNIRRITGRRKNMTNVLPIERVNMGQSQHYYENIIKTQEMIIKAANKYLNALR